MLAFIINSGISFSPYGSPMNQVKLLYYLWENDAKQGEII
jgi:hypothetical protein